MVSSNLLFFSNLFSGDMIIIMIVALFLFGGEKLPEVVRALGKGIREFKDASEGIKREINEQINNYDEKRAESSLNKRAEEIQNQLPANESHQLVENTMPVNDSHFADEEHGNGSARRTP